MREKSRLRERNFNGFLHLNKSSRTDFTLVLKYLRRNEIVVKRKASENC